jgi:predicted GTPase
MKDVQVSKLMATARSLKEIAEEKLARKVLEIDVDSESTKHFELLNRLIRSLEQYIQKTQSLIYIGFVGHFSSGKSSTINKLLDLNETSHQRETGLNPTDKAITLITNQSNSKDLFLMNRESGNVPVRTSFVDSELLSSIVISDTPGSGDPDVVNEMIQDFLPICDYILYFISAANPVDQADLPLLIQKAQKLPFIPIFFVITRTDEFRKNKSQPLSLENFDEALRDQFLGQLISRIKYLTESSEFLPNDFFFIDNVFDFQIKDLRSKLIEWSDQLGSENLINIHGHKVLYFESNLNDIIDFYKTSIEKKIQKSEEFLNTARENITRFDKSVEINNEKLKSLWIKGEVAIRSTYGTEKTSIDEALQDSPLPNVNSDKDIIAHRKSYSQNLLSIAQGYYGRMISDFTAFIKKRISESKNIIFENISNKDLFVNDLSHLFPSRIDIDYSEPSIEIDFSKLNFEHKEFSDALNSVLFSEKTRLRTKAISIKGFLNKELLIKQTDLLYREGNNVISDNFDQYFEKIQMYRTSVLNRNTKETIEKLRIGKQLDGLEVEFPPEFISEMKEKATLQVYYNNELDKNELLDKKNICLDEINDLRVKSDNLAFKKEAVWDLLTKENHNVAALFQEMSNTTEIGINLVYQNKLQSAMEQHSLSFSEYQTKSKEIEKGRKRRIIFWVLGFTLIGVILYFCLKYFSILPPATLGIQILIGIGVNAIFPLLGLLIGRVRNDLKILLTDNKNTFLNSQRAKLFQAFSESSWDEIGKKIPDFKNENNLNSIVHALNEKGDPIIQAVLDEKQQSFLQLIEIDRQINTELKKYQNQLMTYYNKQSVIFKEETKNLENIGMITKQIKETAIKPSFDLLQETSTKLDQVRLKIISV